MVKQVERLVETGNSRPAVLEQVCRLLHEAVDYYDWVGFYLVHPERERELVLGPYVGDPTEHTRIPFGRGICGQAAERGETFVVQDVSREQNYLACSLAVKSEIVVPIFKDGRIVGELDIDSHRLSPFTEADREYLERICELQGRLF
ncbi:MAG: GAF domain-containing protein [Calditrichaeota bacterium]|nr:MAG: GAF domain-containing protein [Calditrichota bacterium]